MLKTLIPAVLLLTVASAIPAAGQRRGAGGGSVTFAIVVSDPSGAPIPDARVALTGPAERSGRTEGGRTVFENLPAGAYRFRFDKEGFISLEREVTARGSVPVDVKVTLTPVPPPPPPPLPPPAPVVDAGPVVHASPVVLDMPAFIEKNYVGKAAGKTTPLGCSTGGPATLLQINDPVATHTHVDADEFIYVIAGQGTATIGERRESLSAGVFMLIPRDTAHAFSAGPKKPLVMVSTRAGEKCGGEPNR
jgi:mannose-6-phosphate isomerase-like protein (cupin superfamily)